MSVFGTEWAERKLNMDRREAEISDYIDKNIPELRTMKSGVVIDIGCGPGDFLFQCHQMGHSVIGIDAPDGRGGMGDAYLELCRQKRREFGVLVKEYGLSGLLYDEKITERLSKNGGSCACVNMRGSIEQALSDFMVGEPHDAHHNCRELDWNQSSARGIISMICQFAEAVLYDGGILMIHANGTRQSDDWYDRTIRECAEDAGLKLVKRSGLLLHKWVKA